MVRLSSSGSYTSDVPVGGTTGLDHAGTGTCPYHSAVVLPPGAPCVECHRQSLLRRPTQIEAVPLPAGRPHLPPPEQPNHRRSRRPMNMPSRGSTRLPMVMRDDPYGHGHQAMGHYV